MRKRIIQFSKDGKRLATFESAKEASRKMGISNQMIGLVARGKIKSAGGFVWRFEDKDERVKIPEPQTFYCQSCGKETPLKERLLVCAGCVKKQKGIIDRKRIIYIPVEIKSEEFFKYLEQFTKEGLKWEGGE